ncbi:MAG: hypothetical protein RR490_03530, partial [Niameybacter sp.]
TEYKDNGEHFKNYRIYITDSDGEMITEMVPLNGDRYKWTPKIGHAGIYHVQATDENGVHIGKPRKIYINDSEISSYYQLKGVGFETVDVQPQVTTGGAYQVTTGAAYTIVDPERAVFGTKIFKKTEGTNPIVDFTIGEEGFWKRTFKEQTIGTNGISFIAEGKDFLLDKGTYTFWTSTKAKGSIEAEDFKKTSYTREVEDHKIENFELVNTGGGNFDTSATCSAGCELVYAFLLHDDLGTKVVSDYKTDNNSYSVGDKGWEYTIEARVKHADNYRDNGKGYLLPNAYEKNGSITVQPSSVSNKLEIDEVEIESYSLTKYYEDVKKSVDGETEDFDLIDKKNKPGYLGEQEIGGNQSTGYVYANNKNYIEVEVDRSKLKKGERFSYKAWVMDDGVTIPLEMYEAENLYPSKDSDEGEAKFVYYPKSGGKSGIAADGDETHKLVVSVAMHDRDGEIIAQTSKEIELEIKNWE